MARQEIETIILLNQGDIDNGFFQIGTSRQGHNNQILRRLAKIGLKPIETTTSSFQGRIVWWQHKIPEQALGNTLCIKRRSNKRSLS